MFQAIDNFIDNMLQNLGVWGPYLGCFFILIESMLPILPLFVFITINFLAFGKIWGFVISWFFTCLGCLISFFLFRKKVQTWLYRHLKKKGLISEETIKHITNLKFEQLTTIMAIPFTPAFLVNILAGLSEMKVRKFLWALLISKIFLVYFWGFIGVGLVQSIKNPRYLVKVVVILFIAYIISFIVNKKLKIK